MKVLKPDFIIYNDVLDSESILRKLEKIGRLCYKSEDKISSESSKKFVKKLIDSGHEAMIEHESITVIFTTDRGVTHEQVRHRIASYAQESTRYCNYTHDKFNGEISAIDIRTAMKLCPKTSILESSIQNRLFDVWFDAMNYAEIAYNTMIDLGASPQIARGVLPTDLKTEIAVTMNLREWRHFFKLRLPKTAHPKIRELIIPLFLNLKAQLPIVFDDIQLDSESAMTVLASR